MLISNKPDSFSLLTTHTHTGIHVYFLHKLSVLACLATEKKKYVSISVVVASDLYVNLKRTNILS